MSLINQCRAFWCFEEASGNRIDSTGRGNDLTPATISGPGLPLDVVGVINHGVGFRETANGYLYLADNDDIGFSGQQSFTIGGWFKIYGYTGGSCPLIVKYNDYGLQYVNASGGNPNRVYFYVNGNYPAATLFAPCEPASGWHYIRGWYDADQDTINLQIDCGTIYSQAFTAGVTRTSQQLQMGRNLTFDYGNLDMDGVGIWARVLDTGEASLLCPGLEYPFGICGAITFGDYEFGNTWHPADDNFEWVPAIGKLPRAHGSRALDFYLPEKRVLIRGGEIQGPFDTSDLRARIDDIKSALAAAPQNLQIEPDRYFQDARVAYFRNPYGPTHYCRIAADMEIEFVCRDPFQYALLPSTDTWSSPTTGATRTITAGGTTPAGKYIAAQPTFSITVGGAGAQTIDYTLKNNTTGQEFRLSGDVTGGQVIVVNTLDQTVKIGTTDEIDLFDGEFVAFDYGANSMEITIASGSISQIATTWRNRFL